MNYSALFNDILDRIRQGQTRAALSVNVEMLALYWDVGRMIAARQSEEGWGAAVIPRLAQDIRNDLVDVKGFSERNLRRMVSFYKEYSELLIRPASLAELDSSGDAIWPAPQAKLTTELNEDASEDITRSLPENFKSCLPTVEEIEKRLDEQE